LVYKHTELAHEVFEVVVKIKICHVAGIKRLTNLDELAKGLRYKKTELEAEGRRVVDPSSSP
jgi:hypothetical protein